MMRIPLTLLAAIALAVAVASLAPARSHAQGVGGDQSVAANLDGPCTAMATLDNGEVIDPSASGGVYTAPHSGSASYTGSIDIAAEPRAFNGKVWVETPPGIPSITIKTWEDDDGENVSDAGSVTWDIPEIVPGGVTVTVSGFHNDAGATCSGSIKVKLEGGITDSPLGLASIVLTVLTGLGLAGAAIPKGQ